MKTKLFLLLTLVGGAFTTGNAAAQGSAEGEKIEQLTTESLNAAARRATEAQTAQILADQARHRDEVERHRLQVEANARAAAEQAARHQAALAAARAEEERHAREMEAWRQEMRRRGFSVDPK
jgi:hypothetical protein